MKIKATYNDYKTFNELDFTYIVINDFPSDTVKSGNDFDLKVLLTIELTDNEYNNGCEFEGLTYYLRYDEDRYNIFYNFVEYDTKTELPKWYKEDNNDILNKVTIQYKDHENLKKLSEPVWIIEIKKYYTGREDIWKENN